MRLFRICLTAVLLLTLFVPAVVAATGTTVVIVKDGAHFRAEFTDAATAPYVACEGERLVCDNAYRVYTTEGTAGAQGVETDNLLLDTVASHWKPFVQLTPTTTRILVQTSTESGIPVYDVALQVPALSATEKINIFFNNKEVAPKAVAMQSLFTYERGGVGCRLCVKRTVYNGTNLRSHSAHSFLLYARKEFLKPCDDGAFTTNEFEVVYTRETLLSLCHIFATPEGNFGIYPPVLGHVGASDFLAEWNSAALTPGFSIGAGVGNRWIEQYQKLGDFGLLLQPQGCKCTSHTAGMCWLLQCELLPPGGGDCPPGDCCCDCDCCCCDGHEDPGGPGDPPTFCPKSQGYWKTHGSEWPIEAILLGDEAYTKAQALVLLNTPVGGDASLNLAHQLIAAKLNLAAGADVTPIAAFLATADLLLTPQSGNLPYGVSPATATGTQMTLIASILDTFNQGFLSNCDE